MTATISITEAANSIPTIVAAEALGALKANTVLAQIVTRDWSPTPATKGQTISIPKRGVLTASDKAANTIVTLQAPSDTAVSLTLNKHKEVTYLIEDPAQIFSAPNLLFGYMEDGVKVIAEAIDADLAALYSGLSQTLDATAGFDEVFSREARRLLNAAKAPQGDRWAVLSEDGEKEALAMEQMVNRDYQGDAGAVALRNGYAGRLHGFNYLMDQQIVSVGGERKNLFLQKNALALGTRPLPLAQAGGVYQTVLSEDGIGLRVTLSYSPDHLGWQCTIDVLYGVAEIRDNHGVVVSTTAV